MVSRLCPSPALIACVALIVWASAIAAAPAGAVPMVVPADNGIISVFSIGASGALTPVCAPSTTCPSDGTASDPEPVAFSPDARHVYVGNYGSNSVSVYSVGAGGALTHASCDPTTKCKTGHNPQGVAVDPSGTHLYVANSNDANVSVFSIGAGGALTPKCDPTTNCPTTGSVPEEVAIDSTGKHLYVANSGSHNVSVFSIGAGGALTQDCNPTTDCPQTGTQPSEPVIDPSGRYLYVPNEIGDSVSEFSIGADGALTQLCTPGTDCPATASRPFGVAIDPSGRHLYTPDYSQKDVASFSIGTGGALTQLCSPGTNCPATTSDAYAAAVNPSGTHLYVPNYTGKSVSVYAIGPGGALTAIACSPATNCQTGGRPGNFAIAIAPDRGPTAVFSASARPGLRVALNASRSASPDYPIAHYGWTFGDGGSQTTPSSSVQHVYPKPGTYTVSLKVTDQTGCSERFITTGQTPFCDGSPKARAVHLIVIPATLTKLSVSPHKFSLAGRQVGGHCVKPTATNTASTPCRRPISLRVSYTLDGRSTVTFTFKRLAPGRKAGGRCVKPSEKNRKHKKCTRLVSVSGKITQSGKTGVNHLTFKGKVGGRKLGLGSYELIATPAHGTPRKVRFTIAP